MAMVLVNLQNCRDLLGEWDAMRARILKGEVSGWAICVRDPRGIESAEFAGSYRDEPDAALRASLHMSWELTRKKTG